MKVNELFEAEFINTILDREMTRMAPKKPGQSDDVKARNAYSRGFRGAFGGRGAEDTGITDATMKMFKQGQKDGTAARKKAGEVPEPFIVKNSYGDKKPNQAFEKAVKTAMAPYLKAVKEELNEAISKDEVIGLTKAEVSKYMKKQGFSKVKVPGGESPRELSYQSDQDFGFWVVSFDFDGKAVKIRKTGS